MRISFTWLLFTVFIIFQSGTLFLNAQTKTKDQTFVIVHGAWGGSWAFKKVDSILSSEKYKVYRPCLTGQGERMHLSSPDINLSTHINDVVNSILFENLQNIVMVGHSYGGMVITGVADRIPERIKSLIYLDAMVPHDGESALSRIGEKRTSWIKSIVRNGLMVPNWNDTTKYPRDVPQSFKTFTQPIALKNIKREKIPAAYILTVEAGKEEDDDFYTESVRARDNGWKVYNFTADHNPQFTLSEELSKMLIKVKSEMQENKNVIKK